MCSLRLMQSMRIYEAMEVGMRDYAGGEEGVC